MQQRIAPGRHEVPAPPRRAAPTQTPSETPTCTRAAGTSAPTTPPPARVLRAPMVGRDVPGAPRQRKRHRKRPRVRGPPERRPLPRTHTWRRPLPRVHGRARRPRRAAPTQTPSETPACTRAAGDVGPYHVRTHGAGPYRAPMVGRDAPPRQGPSQTGRSSPSPCRRGRRAATRREPPRGPMRRQRSARQGPWERRFSSPLLLGCTVIDFL